MDRLTRSCLSVVWGALVAQARAQHQDEVQDEAVSCATLCYSFAIGMIFACGALYFKTARMPKIVWVSSSTRPLQVDVAVGVVPSERIDVAVGVDPSECDQIRGAAEESSSSAQRERVFSFSKEQARLSCVDVAVGVDLSQRVDVAVGVDPSECDQIRGAAEERSSSAQRERVSAPSEERESLSHIDIVVGVDPSACDQTKVSTEEGAPSSQTERVVSSLSEERARSSDAENASCAAQSGVFSLVARAPGRQRSFSKEAQSALYAFLESLQCPDLCRREAAPFYWKRPPITSSSSCEEMISSDRRLRLSSQQKNQVIEGCRAAYDYELKKRGQRMLFPHVSGHWAPVEGAYDVAFVYKYDREANELIIAFRGSMKDPQLGYIRDNDWIRNFTCVPYRPDLYGVGISGKVHAGFLRKYGECQDNLYGVLSDLMEKVARWGQLDSLRLIITGHSLGAAVCQIGAADLSERVLPCLYGAEALKNRMWVVPLSAPCVGDQTAVDFMHTKVGKNNCMRVGVQGDPVMIAGSLSMSEAIKKYTPRCVNEMPLLRDLLGCFVFVPFGHDAYQPLGEAVAESSINKVLLLEGVSNLLSGKGEDHLVDVIEQFVAPVHGGVKFSLGRDLSILGFNPDQFKQMDLQALLRSSQEEEIEISIGMQGVIEMGLEGVLTVGQVVLCRYGVPSLIVDQAAHLLRPAIPIVAARSAQGLEGTGQVLSRPQGVMDPLRTSGVFSDCI